MGTVGRIATAVGTGGLSEAANAASGGGLYGGGGGKGSSGPAAPDFAAAAEAQAKSGHVDQNGPFGSTSWTQGPDGRWSQSTQLAGGLGQGAQNLESQIGSQGPLDNGTSVRQQAIDSTYGQATSRLDPQWAQTEEATRSQLAAQGLDPGSEAYNTQMGNLSRAKNDAYSSAFNNAVSNANQAQALTFGENVAAQEQPYQQLSQINGLTSGLSGQGTQTQYLPGAMANYQGELQNASNQQAGKNSKMSGASMLGAGALMSDERLKTDVERLDDEAIPGVPWARWRWKDGSGDGFGVIAQDLEKVRPDLVHIIGGMRHVDYAGLIGVNHG